MKVLLSAFSCCPGRGSEPGVGWNWAVQISRHHEVWLLTSDEFQSEIEREIPPNIHATFIPSFRVWHWLQRLPVPGLSWVYYYWWQWKAYRAARRLHAKVGFDLAHHVTFVTWRAPSFICLLPVPFVWGPVGGGGTPPRSLAGELGWKGRLSEGFRGLCQRAPRLDPGVRLTMRRAAVIFANVQETASLIPHKYQDKVQIMFGIGLHDLTASQAGPSDKANGDFTVLLAAQLRPIKGGTLALKAFAELVREHPHCRLVVLGEGSEKGRLDKLIKESKLEGKVQFLGWLPSSEVAQWMRRSDVLLHPSLRDSGGMVLLEAMVQEKPVVCLDLGGPAHIVTPECGFKVSPTNPREVVEGLASALKQLAQDPALCRSLGEAGHRRVQEQFDWASRGDQMASVYSRLVSERR